MHFTGRTRRACHRNIRTRRYPPSGWSWPDWFEEIEAVCIARAFGALREFDQARGVPLAAFLYAQVHYALSERYRQENRYAAHCLACSLEVREPANPDESIDPEDGAAAMFALQEMPDKDRRLLERLVLEGESITHMACDWGVSRRTISRRKDDLLERLRSGIA
jgi:DNA-directed RNA polymerase specialized sigma24 family protein